MPQLDQFTYLTQFVWFSIFYMTFYVLLFNDGLPKISRILKLRAHLVSQSAYARPIGSAEARGAADLRSTQSGSVPAHAFSRDVSGKAGGIAQDVVFRTLKSGISYLYSSVTGASSWCTRSVDSLNANQLKAMNKSYLRSLGEISLSHLLKYSALDASAPALTRGSTAKARAMLLNTSRVWALRIQKCLFSSINKKKKKK